ncbi:unnamed protein product [Parnassius apollo]|uniref:(apollo) hypothetical protein n=1 Tax=Parnassius apollo TaxID=110799 RepID=A0A8S3XKL2_PARAO|nr:unnamed protein product [Parnassius apollo]
MIRLNVSYLYGKIIRVGGGTSNMLAHLKRSHPQATVPVNPEQHAINDKEQSIPLTSNNTDQEHPRKTLMQIKLKMNMGNIKKEIDEYLTLMIATNF